MKAYYKDNLVPLTDLSIVQQSSSRSRGSRSTKKEVDELTVGSGPLESLAGFRVPLRRPHPVVIAR